jgi:hypothetical protein
MFKKQLVMLLALFFATGSCQNKTPRIATSIQIPLPMGVYPKGFVPDSTDLYAVIKFDEKDKGIFPSNYHSTTLTKIELKTVDSLIIMAYHNMKYDFAKKGYRPMLNLKEYRRQLIAAIDTKGNKIVYVNGFSIWPIFEKTWKIHLTKENDGGISFFHLFINLKKKKYYDAGVNGLA